MLHYNKDIKNAIITSIILMFILIISLLNYGYAESINQITLKKEKYYICEDVSNYSGSPGVDKNPEEFYKKNCETSPSLIGSSICLKNNHCKLDKLFLEEYLDKECKKISKTKHKQYFIKNSKKNSKDIEVTYECRKKNIF